MNAPVRRAYAVPPEIDEMLAKLCPGSQHASFRHTVRVACAQVILWREHRKLAITVRDDMEADVLAQVAALLERAVP